eukprot:gene7616-9368_t
MCTSSFCSSKRICTKYSLENEICDNGGENECLPAGLMCQNSKCVQRVSKLIVGQSCKESSQCSTNSCTNGICNLPDGQKCKEPYDCMSDEYCSTAGTCNKRKKMGEICEFEGVCQGSLICDGYPLANRKCIESFSLGQGSPCDSNLGKGSLYPNTGCDIGQGLWCSEKSNKCENYNQLITPSSTNCSLDTSDSQQQCNDDVPEACICNGGNNVGQCKSKLVLNQKCKDQMTQLYRCTDESCRLEFVCEKNQCESDFVEKYGFQDTDIKYQFSTTILI